MKTYPIIENFLSHKEFEKGLTRLSILTYRTIFEVVDKYPQYIDLADPRTFTTQNFRSFLYTALKERNWCSLTADRYRRNLKCFCKYLVNERIIQENPLDRIERRKIEKSLPKAYSEEEMKKILSSVNFVFLASSRFENYRNIAIVKTFSFTGLRLSELQNLRVSDVRLSDGCIFVNKGKGDRDRFVPIPEGLKFDLVRYMEERKMFPEAEFFFTDWEGKFMSKKVLIYLFSKLSSCVGFRVWMHRLRHSFATALCRAQVNLYYVQKILGHSSPTTTQIYLSFDLKSAKDSIDNIALFHQ